MNNKIGLLTIGQSPRPEIVREIAPLFGKNIDLYERGALDNLTIDQVKDLFPEDGMKPLCTRMSDGVEVIVAKEKIMPQVNRAINLLNKERVILILLLCVGSFTPIESECLVIQPQQITDRCVEALIGVNDHLGVLVPIYEQEIWARENFAHITHRITVTTASPYGDRSGMFCAGQVLKEANCDLIVMYCMGYTQESKRLIRSITGKPVILANSLAARTIGELLEQN